MAHNMANMPWYVPWHIWLTLSPQLIPMFKALLLLFSCCTLVSVNAQSDKALIKDIKRHISYLADDQLEGRRTGTVSEKKAYEYIIKQFKKQKLSFPPGWNSYLQPFEVNEGKMPGAKTRLQSGDWKATLETDFIPLPYSAQSSLVITELSQIDLINTAEITDESATNPHFDLEEKIYQLLAERAGVTGARLILLHHSEKKDSIFSFDRKNKRAELSLPVIWCNDVTLQKIKSLLRASAKLDINVEIVPNIRTGHNVAAWVDNKAALTVVIGAHYDHLGYGEDHNSLYVGQEKKVHNGADDNASGTSAMLALAEWLKKNGDKKFNYLMVAFSGEELGLYGSKYFTEHCPVDFSSINYMINMDMVGRLNDSTHAMTVGGYGTSPAWGKLIDTADAYFKIKVDSAGIGPSDHTSFYKKDLPVLFFFTGTHSDYHKPSDDADKVNAEGTLRIMRYIQNIIAATSQQPKLAFSKTREGAAMGKSSFKVTMGIMPDYTYSGNGVRVDGVTDNRPAQKAGILTNDVILQLGDFTVTDVQTYMQALGKHQKGQSIKVKVQRGKDTLELPLTF